MTSPFGYVWSLVAAEPVAAQVLMQALMTTGCAFGLHLSVEQIAAINVLTAAVLGFFLRRSVTPLAKQPPA